MKARPMVQREEEDLLLKLFYGLLGLIFKGIRYMGRRTLQNPAVGLLYLAFAGPAAFIIVQDLRLLWATTTARSFTRPAPVWPLSEPLQPVGLVLLVLVILSVVGVDRWIAYKMRAHAAETESKPDPLRVDEWVLGRMYRRTWNPDPGEFQLTETPELCKLTEDHLRTHMIVVAPQGGGKTSSVLKPALQLFKRTGSAVICIDGKGADFDPAEFHLNFDPQNPRDSMRLNVWSGSTPEEMGERLAEALVPELSEEKKYFSDNAKDTLSTLAMAHYTLYREMPSLRQVLAYVRDPGKREDLGEELRNTGLPEESEELAGMGRIDQLGQQKNDPLGSLDTALAPLTRGSLAQLLTTEREGYSIEQLLREPVRVRFALAVGERPRVAPILGRLVLAQFTHAVISPECNKSILKAAVVDEAHNFVTPAIAKGMAMARENRGCYILAVQDLSQIEDPTLRENILSVAGNKMVMAGIGDFDARKFSALFGARERHYTSHSQGTVQGRHSSQSRGSGNGGYGAYGTYGAQGDGLLGSSLGSLRQQSTRGKSFSHQQSEGSSVQLRERAEFLTSEIRGLPRFHAIIERRDNRGEVTPATVVHLDRETITDALTVQALKLYNSTGSLTGAVPRLPALKGRRLVESARVPARVPHVEHAKGKDAGLPEQAQPTGEAAAISQASVADRTRSQDAHCANPEWVRTTARQVAATLGINGLEAEELVLEAYRKGRDRDYLMDNLQFAVAAPNVENSAELFRFLIRSNQHRQSAGRAGASNAPEETST